MEREKKQAAKYKRYSHKGLASIGKGLKALKKRFKIRKGGLRYIERLSRKLQRGWKKR